VDLYAPGTFILSDWITTDSTAVYLSAPAWRLACDRGGRAVSGDPPTASSAEVASYLVAAATGTRITAVGTGSPTCCSLSAIRPARSPPKRAAPALEQALEQELQVSR